MAASGSQQSLEGGDVCLNGSPPRGPLSSLAWEGPSLTHSPHPGGHQPPPHSVWRVCRKEAQHCANRLLRRQPSPDGPTLQQLRPLCEARPPSCVRERRLSLPRPPSPGLPGGTWCKLPPALGSCSHSAGFSWPTHRKAYSAGSLLGFLTPTAPSPCDLSPMSWLSYC